MQRIPDRALPHEATISPFVGRTARGLEWGEPREPVRANFNPRSKSRMGGGSSVEIAGMDVSVTTSATVILDGDVELHVLDRVRSSVSGEELVVAGISTWDMRPAQRFLEVTLAIL